MNSIVNQRLHTSEGTASGNGLMNTMDFSLFDLYGIQQIQQQKNVLKYSITQIFTNGYFFKSTTIYPRLLVHSLSPSIYGHELVKAALLMALFGGRVRDEDGVCIDLNVLEIS